MRTKSTVTSTRPRTGPAETWKRRSGIGIAVLAAGLVLALLAPIGPASSNARSQGGAWPEVVRSSLDRWPSDAPSNSGHTVEEECGESGWQKAQGQIKITQTDTRSRVTITIWKAKPNTLYTAWLRLNGTGPGGDTIGGNPMTGGGATALLPSSGLDTALLQSPPLPGTDDPLNGFTTNRDGRATWSTVLDFPVIGGAYPFQAASDEAVQALADAGSTWPLVRIPSPVVDPTDPDITAPFLIRVVSHCQDGLAHGLSPAARETWFQYP